MLAAEIQALQHINNRLQAGFKLEAVIESYQMTIADVSAGFRLDAVILADNSNAVDCAMPVHGAGWV
jgi:hypothetical protein